MMIGGLEAGLASPNTLAANIASIRKQAMGIVVPFPGARIPAATVAAIEVSVASILEQAMMVPAKRTYQLMAREAMQISARRV
jgi:hypothetical protein